MKTTFEVWLLSVMQTKVTLDRKISWLAERQHGVVAYWQLDALGLGAGAIKERDYAGWLHRVHKGVFAVGHRKLTQKGKWMAAVLACGKTAVLSGFSAAELHGLITVLASRPIEVTVARGNAPDRAPIVTSKSSFEDDEWT